MKNRLDIPLPERPFVWINAPRGKPDELSFQLSKTAWIDRKPALPPVKPNIGWLSSCPARLPILRR